VTTDLCELFATLVLPLERPEGRSLSAAAIPGAGGHRLAKDSSGSPCLLLNQPAPTTPATPIRLQNLLVSYGVHCLISHPDGQQEEGNFTIVRCSSADPALFSHFLRILSPVITTLGATPTPAVVRGAISGLVDLFQALTTPAKKSVQGLWAELLLIRGASDPLALAGAWHALPAERTDFLSGRQRIEVKSSSNRRRVHHFSLVQLTPPASTQLIVASIFVESVGGGLSLSRLSNDVRAILATEPALLTRFDAVFYATLGTSWSDAMDECFDLELATESLQFFDHAHVPTIAGPIPTTVSDVRFTSDMSRSSPLGSDPLISAGGLFAAVVPVR
jgi:Putative  PD-(D/E)XK family member, (DUF4420)